MDDQEIIFRIKQGEIEYFRHLVDKYSGPLLKFINTITRNPFLTEEVGQTVFLSFFQTLESFDETNSKPVSAWLFAAARNQAINVIKKERSYLLVSGEKQGRADSRPGPLDLLIHQEDRKILEQSLAQLQEPYRTTLIESLKGYSIKEIAANKMILPGTVKSRLNRARQKLRELLRTRVENYHG